MATLITYFAHGRDPNPRSLPDLSVVLSIVAIKAAIMIDVSNLGRTGKHSEKAL